MSSNLTALLSTTFFEAGYEHLVEIVHQQDPARSRRIASLRVEAYDESGRRLCVLPVDERQDVIDLGALLRDHVGGGRAMVLFDARYDEAVFPYRPHHYAFLHRIGSPGAPLYYAVNSVLGGFPRGLEATRMNNFETYLFLRRPLAERYALILGNASRFASAQAEVIVYYRGDRAVQNIVIAPKAHVEVPLPSEQEGCRIDRVELKSLFRLANYVVGRHAATGELVLFDHLFTYFR